MFHLIGMSVSKGTIRLFLKSNEQYQKLNKYNYPMIHYDKLENLPNNLLDFVDKEFIVGNINPQVQYPKPNNGYATIDPFLTNIIKLALK